jgi:hypothetical protein
MVLRESAVKAAQGEIGPGNPAEYWRICEAPDMLGKAWCGAFVLRSLKVVGLAPASVWVVARGFAIPDGLPTTDTPRPGDVAYFNRAQHHAMVAGLDPLVTIDGNAPDVKRRIRMHDPADVYYSIEPYLEAELNRQDAEADATRDTEPPSDNAPTEPPAPIPPRHLAVYGDRDSPAVAHWQLTMVRLGLYSGNIDGHYGPKTQASIYELRKLALRKTTTQVHPTDWMLAHLILGDPTL